MDSEERRCALHHATRWSGFLGAQGAQDNKNSAEVKSIDLELEEAP